MHRGKWWRRDEERSTRIMKADELMRGEDEGRTLIRSMSFEHDQMILALALGTTLQGYLVSDNVRIP